MRTKFNRKGITLIEALFVLGIFAIILGMAYYLYSLSVATDKTAEARKEFLLIRQAITDLYNGQPLYVWNTLDEKTLVQNNVLPAKYVDKTNNQLLNPWGGQVVIYNVDQGDLQQSYFQIVFYGVPKSGCNTLAANHDWMNAGPATQVNNYQDNAITPLNISFIVNNVCLSQYNMFAWATSDGN